MTPTERLRELLDERGVEWEAPASYDGSTKYDTVVGDYWFHEYDGKITIHGLTPEQAIAAALGPRTCQMVYLVETSDDLFESWYPFAVYLHREAAEDCAEALRTESDGVRSFAKVSELKVVDE